MMDTLIRRQHPEQRQLLLRDHICLAWPLLLALHAELLEQVTQRELRRADV